MIAESFLDTNVFVYAAIGHRREPHKYERAVTLIETVEYCTSGQVLAEFFVNVTRKAEDPLPFEVAADWVATIALKPCQAVDERIVLQGIENAERYRISYWDGAIIAAAARLGARTVYSEDLSHGQLFGEVRVINPFLET